MGFGFKSTLQDMDYASDKKEYRYDAQQPVNSDGEKVLPT